MKKNLSVIVIVVFLLSLFSSVEAGAVLRVGALPDGGYRLEWDYVDYAFGYALWASETPDISQAENLFHGTPDIDHFDDLFHTGPTYYWLETCSWERGREFYGPVLGQPWTDRPEMRRLLLPTRPRLEASWTSRRP